MFGFFKSLPYEAPIIGTLNRRQGKWWGSIALPPSIPQIPIALSGNQKQPDDLSIMLASQLPTHYPALLPDIQKELFIHAQPYIEAQDSNPPLPELRDDDSLWQHVQLIGILIEPLGKIPTIELAYQTLWDEEHTLGAQIQNWQLSALNGSIFNIFR
ncbi:MAG: DUF6985 domain-containing protein [Alphaproteobacteria bacterium]